MLQTLRRNIPNHNLSIVIRLNLDPLFRQCKHSRLKRIHVVTTRNTFPPRHLVTSLQCCTYRLSSYYSPSSTRATFPRQVTHVPWRTKLLPWTTPEKSVMVVMSRQWGHQTFCKTCSWKCGGIASQSIWASGVNGGCIGWRPLVMMCYLPSYSTGQLLDRVCRCIIGTAVERVPVEAIHVIPAFLGCRGHRGDCRRL
jgi:hypothetical protein